MTSQLLSGGPALARILPGPMLPMGSHKALISREEIDRRCHTLLFTRYFLHGGFGAANQPERAAPKIKSWFRAREPLFRSYTLPSVLGQVQRSFTWYILVDEQYADWVPKEIGDRPIDPRIRLVTGDRDGRPIGSPASLDRFVSTEIDRQFEQMMAAGVTNPVVTAARLDNDDAIARDYVYLLSCLALSAVHSGQQSDIVVSFPHGLQYLCGRELSTYIFNNNHFLASLHLAPKATGRRIHALSFNHSYVFAKAPNTLIANTDLPMWIEVVHGKNLVNQYRPLAPRRDNEGIEARFCSAYPIGEGPSQVAAENTTDRTEDFAQPSWADFSGSRALANASLQDGRFSVRLGDGRFHCLLQRQPGSHLFVLLSGPRPAGAGKVPFFERWRWAWRLPGSLLYIADPLLALSRDDLRVGWYVGTANHPYQLRLAGLVRTIADKLGIASRHIVCCGSTSGGFAALMLAAHLKDATALAINPHTQVLKCSRKLVDELRRCSFEGRATEQLTPEERRRLSAIAAFRHAPDARCLLVQNLTDAGAAATHFRPFCAALGIPPDGGADETGRRRSMVFDQAQVSSGVPAHMFESMMSAALKLTQNDMAQVPTSCPQVARIKTAQIYLIHNRRQPKRQSSIDFVPRKDLAAFPIRLPLDWSADPFTDSNWCAQLHMWRMLDNHLLEFEQTKDPEWLALPLAVVDDWHHYHVVRKLSSKFAWMDMMVGLRAMKLAYLLSADDAGAIQLGRERRRTYGELVDLHLQFLLDPGNIAYSNHSLIDMQGLAALGVVSSGSQQARACEFLQQVMPKLLASQFDSSGVHLENSTGYQAFGISCLERLAASGWFGDFGVVELLDHAREIEEWFRLPDGRCVPIGDTDGAAMTGRMETAFKARRQLVEKCGYVIYRDDGNGRCDKASYLFLMAAFNSCYHKQHDDLSFVWYEGEDIVCDAGKFAYKSSDARRYVLSASAHNSIEFDGRNNVDNINRRPDLAYGSAVRQALSTSWGCVVSAQVRHVSIDVVHTRHLIYADKRWLLVIDAIVGRSVHDCVQWFHFSPHLDLRQAGHLSFRASLRSGSPLDVVAASPSDLSATLVKGQLKPVRQGWISQSYGELTPCHALGLAQRGRAVSFATLLSIDDEGSTLTWSDDQAVEASIRSAQSELHLRVDLHDSYCEVSLQADA